MNTQPIFSRPIFSRRHRQRGFTLAEVTLAMIIFGMMTLMFAAVFPMAVRGAQYSSNYSQGAMLAQHKLDQLRTAGYNRLVDSNQLLSMNIIDAVNANGSYDFTTSDTLVDSGANKGFFPPGSTGTITVSNYTAGGVPSTTLMAYVTVTIAWTGGGVANGSTSVSAIISKDGQP